jgi:Cu(I)/Ag(I) efflux system membrane fusion protein
MKCAEGKCGTSMKSEPLPQKIVAEKTRSKAPTVKQLFSVKTVKVKRLESSTTEENYGYIVAKDSSKVDVVAWYSGFVETLYADTRYAYIKKGEALAKVYSPEVYKAKQDYLNSLKYSQSHNSKGMLQSARAKLSLLGISNKAIQDIKRNRSVDEFSIIYAPSSGFLFVKAINKGSAFKMGQKLFEIVNLEKVWIELKIFQKQIKNLDKIVRFEVTIEGISQSYEATSPILYPIIDPKETTSTLRLSVKNKKGLLKVGMYVRVKASSPSKSRLIIPRTAVIRKGGRWYAFLKTDFEGEYEPIEIKIIPLNLTHYEVTKGLTTKDTLVNNALFMMDSDAQINAIY